MNHYSGLTDMMEDDPKTVLCATLLGYTGGVGEIFIQLGESDDMPVIIFTKLSEPAAFGEQITQKQIETSKELFGIRFDSVSSVDYLNYVLQEVRSIVDSKINDKEPIIKG